MSKQIIEKFRYSPIFKDKMQRSLEEADEAACMATCFISFMPSLASHPAGTLGTSDEQLLLDVLDYDSANI